MKLIINISNRSISLQNKIKRLEMITSKKQAAQISHDIAKRAYAQSGDNIKFILNELNAQIEKYKKLKNNELR